MRRLTGLGVAVAVVLSLLVGMPANALAPSLHVTADNLPTWQTNGIVWGIASAQGKVFAGGSFTQARPPGVAAGGAGSLNRANLVVLDAATGAPTSCVLNVARAAGSAVVRAVTDLAGQDGRLHRRPVRHRQRNRPQEPRRDQRRCLHPGQHLQPAAGSFVYAIATTTTTVYFGGNFPAVGTTARSRLAAVTTAGALLPWAPTSDDETLALAVDPNNGNVVIGGRSSTMNGQDSNALAVVDGGTGKTNIHNYPRGFFPWTPGTGQRTGTSAVKAIAVDGTGFYVGNEGTGTGIFDGRSAFNWGTYAQRWRDNCLGATQALVPINGVVYAATHSHNCESENTFEDGQRHFFTAESTSDKTYQPWWPQANDGIGEGIGPRALTLASTGSGDICGAAASSPRSTASPSRASPGSGKAPDTGAPVVPATPNVISLAAGQATVTWRTTTDNDDKTLTYTLYRGTSATPIATMTRIPSSTSGPSSASPTPD